MSCQTRFDISLRYLMNKKHFYCSSQNLHTIFCTLINKLHLPYAKNYAGDPGLIDIGIIARWKIVNGLRLTYQGIARTLPKLWLFKSKN